MLSDDADQKMAEDFTDYLLEMGIQVRLHSEVDTLRGSIVAPASKVTTACLVGINLLARANLPECRWWRPRRRQEGFLRSSRSLIAASCRRGAHVRRQNHRLGEEAIDETENAGGPADRPNEGQRNRPTAAAQKIADILDQTIGRPTTHNRRGRRIRAQRIPRPAGSGVSPAGRSAPACSRAATPPPCRAGLAGIKDLTADDGGRVLRSAPGGGSATDHADLKPCGDETRPA